MSKPEAGQWEAEYKRLAEAVRFAIDYAGGRESEWGDRAEECFRILETAVSRKPIQPTPPANQPDPDEWVVQDRVPIRDVDQWCWKENGDPAEWEWEEGCIGYFMHGQRGYNATLHVRCRRRDLPPVEQRTGPDRDLLLRMGEFEDSSRSISVGGMLEQKNCNGCGKPLLPENAWMEDGCPCNSPRGVNEQPEQWPKYWAKFDPTDSKVAYVKQVSKLSGIVVYSTGHESDEFPWRSSNGNQRKPLTEAEAMALLKKPEPVLHGYAFEPQPETIETLKKRCEHQGRVIVALRKKIYNLRTALKDYMKCQRAIVQEWRVEKKNAEPDHVPDASKKVSDEALELIVHLRDQMDVLSKRVAECERLLKKPEPQPAKTRVRLWMTHNPNGSMIVASKIEKTGDWQEIHHDADGFYTL